MAGMVGCDGPTQYNLTISSTAGGNVTATVSEEETVISQGEEETIFDITEGTVVNLTATPDAGYRFVEWTGNKGTIADVNNATTTITMYNDYSITARFVEGREIRNWDDLAAVRDKNNLDGSHVLMNELNSTTAGYNETASEAANGRKGWQPIGTFTGTFDGQGHNISDLFINRPDETGVGLFGYVGGGGVVQNVTVVNANVTGNSSVGGLVGWNEGKVENSYSSSNVTGNSSVGGLVGYNKGSSVSNSHSSSNVTGGSCVGGLVGYNKGSSVSNSHSSSNVTGHDCVGGLVGNSTGTVEKNSYSTGSVSGENYVGGLVGYNHEKSTVSDSYSSSSVTGHDCVGGLVGRNGGTLSNSSSSSKVTGWFEDVGGLVGWNDDKIEKSYSSGNVTGKNHVGGLVGYNYEDTTVSNSYSSSNVNGNTYVGGLVGWNEGTVSSSNSTGSVTSNNDYVGGLVGWNGDTVEKSHSTGSVNGDENVGGLVGENQGTVEKSCSTGSVTGDSRVGGLVGHNEGGSVSNSYSSSNVTGSDDYVGGLVGYNERDTVEDSYSTGNVTGDQYVGGLVGYNEQSRVENSYSTGRVTGNKNLGGLVGRNNEGTAPNSFWDIETSGRTKSEGGTGKTTAEMKNIATFSDAGWTIIAVAHGQTIDDDYTWNIAVDPKTYPFLSWQSVIQPAVAELLKSDKERITSPDVSTSEQALLVEGNSAFAFELYQALKGKEGNIFYSPYSISLALAMTYAGARGETAEQMADTLQFLLEQDRLHPAFNWLDAELAKRGEGAEGQDGEGFRLNIVNAIWGQKDYEFLTDFLDVLAENYGAGLRILDFMTETEKSRLTINDWVSNQTEERIKDLIPPGAIDALTRLVLTNAIYFNAAWDYPFNGNITADGPFYKLDSGQIIVPMMKQTESFGYTEGEGYQAVELRYDGDELSMVILLPASGNFEAFEEGLQAQQVNDIIRGLQRTLVALTMPQFEFDSEFRLAGTLADMGMPVAFSGGADFSGMTGNRELFISEVVHKAFVSVDEAGTEAAAATAVVMAGSGPEPPVPVEVTIDRPFIFLIRDIETGAILFVGRVLNPAA
jgi:serpin B